MSLRVVYHLRHREGASSCGTRTDIETGRHGSADQPSAPHYADAIGPGTHP